MSKLILGLVICTLPAVAVISFGGYLNSMTCRFRECCHPDDGTGYLFYKEGAKRLHESLKTKVHGQPLITSPIYKAILAHVSDNKPSRPLVMYFSGWTGTGKTYVSRLIAECLYKEGMKSRFVNYISSSYHFPIKIETVSEITRERNRLRDLIKSTVEECDRSLIILDELDKLPSGVVDILQPLIDYVEDVDGVSYNKAIIIFLSNTGSESLNRLAYKVYKESKSRSEISAKDVHDILWNESYNEKGGLGQSSIIKRHGIGVFVPFLPLEREHVKLCIEDELKRQAVDVKTNKNLIEQIIDEMLFFPPDTQLYSKSGCKGVRDKVINYIEPYTHSTEL